MTYARKTKGKAFSVPAGLGLGAAISVGLTIVLAWVLAKLILSETILEGHIGYGVMILLLISSFCGAFTAQSKIKRQRLVMCILSGILYLVILLAITALFFGGQYDAVGVTTLLVLGGSVTAGLIGKREKKAGKGRRAHLHIC